MQHTTSFTEFYIFKQLDQGSVIQYLTCSRSSYNQGLCIYPFRLNSRYFLPPWVNMRLSGCMIAFASLSGLAQASLVSDPVSYGYWDVNINRNSDAMGRQSFDISAIYSGNPNKTLHDGWRCSEMGESTDRNEPSFSAVVGHACGNGTSGKEI